VYAGWKIDGNIITINNFIIQHVMFYIKSEDQREMKHKVQRETLLTVCTEVVRNKVFKHDGF